MISKKGKLIFAIQAHKNLSCAAKVHSNQQSIKMNLKNQKHVQ